MNVIFLLLFFTILLFVFAYCISGRDILSPSSVMCIMFIISTMFAILNIRNWNIDYCLDSWIILLCGMFVFIIAESIMHAIVLPRHYPQSTKAENCIQPILVQKIVLIMAIIFDTIVLIWFYAEIKRIVFEYGFQSTGVGIFGSYRTIITSLNQRSDSTVRLTGIILNQMIKLLHAMGYVSLYILLNNLFIKKRKNMHSFLHCIILAMHILSYLMEGSRGTILQIASAALIQWYILWHRKVGWNKILTGKVIAIGIMCILVGMPLFYNSLALMGRATNKKLLRYVGFYVGGSIQLFNLYIQSNKSMPKVFGEESLIGVLRLLNKLGGNFEIRNTNLDMIRLDELSRGNVYTFFRRPLHDFGFIGMLIFTIMIAWLFAWIYYGKIKYKNNKFTPYWILLYGYMFYWIVIMSIDQYSQSYLSLTTVIQIILIFLWFFFSTHFKIESKDGDLVLRI